jgi:hypothetical protein
VTKEMNLANLSTAKDLHALLTVGPRMRRRDETLNEQTGSPIGGTCRQSPGMRREGIAIESPNRADRHRRGKIVTNPTV